MDRRYRRAQWGSENDKEMQKIAWSREDRREIWEDRREDKRDTLQTIKSRPGKFVLHSSSIYSFIYMHMFWYSDHKDKRKDLIVAFRPCKVAQSKDTDRKNRMRARKSNLQSWGSYLASIKEWKKSKKTYRTERWYYITMACQSLQMNGRWRTGCIFVLICGRNSGRKQRHEMRSHTDHLTFFYAAFMISINYGWILDSISSISYKLFNKEILKLKLQFKNQWSMQKTVLLFVWRELKDELVLEISVQKLWIVLRNCSG